MTEQNGKPEEQKTTMYFTIYPSCKTLADRVIAALMLLLALPVVLLAAVAVKLTSPGPAFYSQTRLGRHGQPYRIYKIRTMHQNCEALTGPVWARPDDPRATGVGRFLRKIHLDELPQLWNVLCGHMSLVGPRPERPEIAARLDHIFPAYRTRLVVRPGITGLAQLLHSADTDLKSAQKKLAFDLCYVRGVGPLMDLRILIATPLYLLGGLPSALAGTLLATYRDGLGPGMLLEPVALMCNASPETAPSAEHRSAA